MATRSVPRPPRYALTFGPDRHEPGFLSLQLPSGIRGADTARRLIAHSLAGGTHTQYGRHFAHFMDYCASEGLCHLPADPWTVVAYIGHIADTGRWAEGSLQPILSSINRAHRDAGLVEPAKEFHFLTAARQGMGRAQAATTTRDTRVPLPAEALVGIVHDGEAACIAGAPATLRDDLAICLTALFAGRQDTGVSMYTSDFGVEHGVCMWVRLTEKGKRGLALRRVLRLSLTAAPVHGHASILPRIAALAEAYTCMRSELCAARGVPVPEFMFQLPGERRPTTTTMSGWLSAALQRTDVAAPPGFAYLGHSIRSLGASAMNAIGVVRTTLCWIGGWARGSDVPERHYIDPTFLPSPACYMLYGWLLSRQFTTDAGVYERARVLPDPLDDERQPS